MNFSHRRRGRAPLLLAVLLLALLRPGLLCAEELPRLSEREKAVSLARQGRIPEALAALEALHGKDPGDLRTLGDLLVVLHWSGDDRRVFDLACDIELSSYPLYVGEAVARAARNIGRFDLAVPLYRNLRGRFPESWTSALGLALSLAESGRTDNALALGRELAALHPENSEILLGLAWIHRYRKEHFEALRLGERVLSLQPENAGAHRLRILSVADLGAPFLALQEAEKRPGVLGPDEIRRLRGERGSLAVRWGALPVPSPADRFAATDRALALLEGDLKGLPPDAPAGRRLRLDRLVALRDRFRMEEVVAEHERLEKEGVELPPYLLRAAGDAYLHLRRPREAVRLYRRALKGMPGDFETHMALFYALVEAEEWEEAFDLVDAAAAQEPPWRWIAGAKDPRENPQKEEADAVALMGRGYGEMLGEAQKGLEPMLAAAPRNTDLRQKVAAVYRWRGWPSRAEEEYRIALAHDPDSLQARIGLAHTLLDLKEFAAAGRTVETLTGEYPENRQVGDLAGRWRRERQWRLVTGAGYAAGEEERIGTRELTLETLLYAPPVALHWRPFLRGTYEEAKVAEGTASYRRTGVGIEYEARRWRLSGEVDAGFAGGADPGLTLEAAWSPGDLWTFAARGATFSTEVPLRARRQDIDGRSLRLSVLRRWHESRNVRFAAGVLDMSDGNTRSSGQLAWEERLFARPRFRLTGIAELYASANSRRGAPYFNPEEDAAASVASVWEWLLWRRYDASFRHRLLLGAGAYAQKGFGIRPTWTAGYEQEWHPAPDFGLRYGANWASRVYDGDREDRIGYHLEMDWRF